MKHPFAFTMGAEARHDSLKLRLDAGDLNLRFRAHSTVSYTHLDVYKRQVIQRRKRYLQRLDHMLTARIDSLLKDYETETLLRARTEDVYKRQIDT